MPVLHYAGGPLPLPAILVTHFGFTQAYLLHAIDKAVTHRPVNIDGHVWTDASVPELTEFCDGFLQLTTVGENLLKLRRAGLIYRINNKGGHKNRALTRVNYARLGTFPGINCVWSLDDSEYLPFGEVVQQ